MSRRDKRGDRNRERLRNQADTEPYERQDIRPDYEHSRVEDERRGEQEDVEIARQDAPTHDTKDRG